MNSRDRQILALRTAYIAGIFSLIVCIVMMLNYWQLKTTDPLESEALKTLVERLQEDASNEELKLEIRNLDLMSRNAYFTNQWQIRSGAFLLIGGIIIMVVALRIYYSLKAKIQEPGSDETKLDIELLISRKWIIYTMLIIFGGALIASLLSIDHLSDTYSVTELAIENNAIPVQQIVPIEEPGSSVSGEESDDPEVIVNTPDASAEPVENETAIKESTSEISRETAKDVESPGSAFPGPNEILAQYPSFRGPFGLGISHHANIPTSWDGGSGDNVLWKIKVPLEGYSSPVIWNNQLFLTGANANDQSVYCYDIQTGNLRWEHKVSGIARNSDKKVRPSEDTGFAAPTVTTDGKHVYAIFATGDLVCIDVQGNRVWARNMGVPDNHYGHSSSLLLWKELLFIQFDTNTAGKVLALNALSGEQVWETVRSSKISWASPILANFGNHYELVLASSPEVAAYDPKNGNELWSLECLSGEVGPSPAFYNGIVFAANEYASLLAIKPGNPATSLWETNEYLPEVSSPVASDGLLFIGTSYGVIVCFDINNGEILWEYESDQGFYASPVIVDGKVYFLDMDGKMHIFSLNKTMTLISEPELGEGAVSTPAFANGKIFIRGYEHLYCIGK